MEQRNNARNTSRPQEVLSTLKEAYVKTLLPRTRQSISDFDKLTEDENRGTRSNQANFFLFAASKHSFEGLSSSMVIQDHFT
jgi:hypothetical protein